MTTARKDVETGAFFILPPVVVQKSNVKKSLHRRQTLTLQFALQLEPSTRRSFVGKCAIVLHNLT